MYFPHRGQQRREESQLRGLVRYFIKLWLKIFSLVTGANIDLVCFPVPESCGPTCFVAALEWELINRLTFVIKPKNLIEGDFTS